MTHIQDFISAGPPFTGREDRSLAGVGANASVLGIPIGRNWSMAVIPTALSTTALAASQTAAASTSITLTAGTGVTTVLNAAGTTLYQVAGSSASSAQIGRNVNITSGGNNSGQTYLVQGYDIYGQLMSERITGPNGNTVSGKKAFHNVFSVLTSAATTTTSSVGFGDAIGMPWAVIDATFLYRVGWATTLAEDAGTFVAASTAAAGTTTGDVRGTYTPSSASDGTRRLVIGAILNGPQQSPFASETTIYGPTQA